MATTTFTPGPWAIDEEYPSDVKQVAGDFDVATAMPGLRNGLDSKTVKANAHLIAAAPDMYEALQKTNSYLNSLAIAFRENNILNTAGILENIIAANAAAILKAEGKEEVVNG